MSNFKIFFKQLNQDNLLPAIGESKDKIVSKIRYELSSVELSNSDKERFSKKVSNLAYSDDFLSDFSDEIGEPMENETEDEFVNRAKNAMKNLLKKRLPNN